MNEAIPEVSVDELEAALRAGRRIHLVDVRLPWEAALASLPGAQLIPLHELEARLGEVRPPDGAEVVCYCHHGVRSLQGAALLRAAGLPAASLAGGIDAWSQRVDSSVPRY